MYHVYFVFLGRIIAETILPLDEHDWFRQSHDKFGKHVLLR